MCFSAEVSAISGIGLVSIGVYIFSKRKIEKHHALIAIMPFIFGIHQFSESFVWLTSNGVLSSEVGWYASQIFAFLAYTFWPIYVPLAMYSFEKSKQRNFSLILLVPGIAVGTYLFYGYQFYSQLSYHPLCQRDVCGSLVYMYEVPYFKEYIKYLYFIPATIPFFFTNNTRIKFIMGPAFIASFPVGIYFSTSATLPSVWCFIAAIISILTIFIFPKK